MVTAIHEIVADGLCIFLASHVQRSGARAINISTTVAQWTAAATWYKRMCCQQRLFHLIFQRICSTAMALISQVFTADAWKHSWLPALRMALPIGERCAAMWFHATDNMSVASNYIVLGTVDYELSSFLGMQTGAHSPTHATLAPRTCADCCCVHLLHRHGDATGSDTIESMHHRHLDRPIKVRCGSARTWRPAHSPYAHAQA